MVNVVAEKDGGAVAVFEKDIAVSMFREGYTIKDRDGKVLGEEETMGLADDVRHAGVMVAGGAGKAGGGSE